jgi:hypothetical protein
MNGVYLDNQAGVQFTLYELKQELKSRGHDINLPNLVDALRICSGVLLSIWRDAVPFTTQTRLTFEVVLPLWGHRGPHPTSPVDVHHGRRSAKERQRS